MASTLLVEEPQKGGFSFENCKRNAEFLARGLKMPTATKTGTTIVGITYKDGVILGADTRATNASIVADKNCEKIHYLASNMYCCGAGTAADTEMTTLSVASQLELHRLNTGRKVPVAVACRLLKQMLFRYQGHIGAALILGGVDSTGNHLYMIYPHGSVDPSPYVTMGSGSLAAMSVFEAGWKPEMTLEEGKKLVQDAIRAGIFNDMGSGSNVDLCVITTQGAEMLRGYEIANKKGKKQHSYLYKPGTTQVISSEVIKIVSEEVIPVPAENMEVECH